MMSRQESIEYIGLGITGAISIAGFLKGLRNDRRIIILLVATAFIAVFGFCIRSPELQMKGANAADFFMSPLIYIGLYGTLRYFYKKKYGIEPTYNRSSWFDPEEERKQNGFDVVVFVLPMFGSLLFPILITALLH